MEGHQSFAHQRKMSSTAYLDYPQDIVKPLSFRTSEQDSRSPKRASLLARKPVSSQQIASSAVDSKDNRSAQGPLSKATNRGKKDSIFQASDNNSISSRELVTPEPGHYDSQHHALPAVQNIPMRQRHLMEPAEFTPSLHARYSSASTPAPSQWEGEEQKDSRDEAGDDSTNEDKQTLAEMYSELIYAHQPVKRPPSKPRTPVSGLNLPGETQSHLLAGTIPSPAESPTQLARHLAGNRESPSHKMSYVDLLQVPYLQQIAPAPNLDNSLLRKVVGNNASLLDTSKTLEMYRANVKKTADPAIQYEFAIFMVQAAMEMPPDVKGVNSRDERLKEARQILHKLADRGYPFAQYYLGDGYSSGLFNKGKEDHDHAFPLFVAASKHGHAESGYRAALCYEFGWGCRKDLAKSAQFFRAAASKNHPGAATRFGLACLEGTMGLTKHSREGVKWLKRAAESADFQYNSAPYELGRLHESGYADIVFKDEIYAAQLFTQSADLGHPESSLVMGKAYEYGKLMCPRDPALSIHFYNGAAQSGIAEAMMALCAWYLFGADPILPKDENEAFEWAKRAATTGYAKAEYAVGYFKEIGIGTPQNPLEANVWYVRAAQQGEERAKQRLAIIQGATSAGTTNKNLPENKKSNTAKKGLFGLLK